ncbi:MAG: hypothetical protein AB1899_00050 [Pseudomonadota bacterium]
MNPPPTPELLQSFVDGELAAEERARVLAWLERDSDSRARACELRTLKELVKGAYAEVPRSVAPSSLRPWREGAWRALAAGLVLAVGLAGGWLARDRGFAGDEPGIQHLAGLPGGYHAVALAEQVDPGKVILHLDSGEQGRLKQVLDLADQILAANGPGARVEVVANSYGLDLLRSDVTPLAPRIAAMARRHANLSFVACGQTVARLKREGVRVDLLPDAHMASSAINEIMTRMGQGWVYVKV